MSFKHASQSPFVERREVTLIAGKQTFTHGMIDIEKSWISPNYSTGTAFYSASDAAAVATGANLGGGWTAPAAGVITEVIIKIGTNGSDEATTGTYARADDGTIFTDEDAAALSATANDMTLMPAVPAQNDAYYFGIDDILFKKLTFVVAGTNGVASASTLVWEYYNGSAWVALVDLVDGTSGLTDLSAGTEVTWTPQSNWAEVAINGVTCFWIRVTEDNASPSWSQVPIGSQIDLGVGIIVDVNIDGTTCFTTQKNRPMIFDEDTTLRVKPASIESASFAATNAITVDVDYVALGTAPQDLTVEIYGYIDEVLRLIKIDMGEIILQSSIDTSTTTADVFMHGMP